MKSWKTRYLESVALGAHFIERISNLGSVWSDKSFRFLTTALRHQKEISVCVKNRLADSDWRDDKMAGCEESCGFYFVFALVTFFVWMDLSFFDELGEHGSFYNSTMAEQMMFPVKTIKLRMQDHTDHYVNLPWMQFLNENTGLYAVPGVTPNLISGFHLFIAMVAAKCFVSGSLGIRRVGALLYEIRCQLDILDGVVFRAQQNLHNNFMSVWGSMGYLVDAFADMCGGLIIAGACTIFLNRYPPWKRVRTKPHDEPESGRKIVGFPNEEEERYVHVNRRAVNIKMLLVVIQIIARSGFWDHYLHSYVDLLEKPNPDIPRVSVKDFNLCEIFVQLRQLLFSSVNKSSRGTVNKEVN